MRNRLATAIWPHLPALLSGGLAVLAFPRFDLSVCAWFAFVPLLLSLWQKRGREAFIAGFVFGIVFFFGTLFWISHSITYYGGIPLIPSLFTVLLLSSYLALYPAFFAWFFSLVLQKTKLPATILAPVFWVVLEYIRAYALTGFPWASIGYSQHAFLPLIQVADITGIYGVSFLVLAFNGALTDIVLLGRRVSRMPLFPHSYTIAGFVFLGCFLAFSLVYGFWRLHQERPGHLFTAAIIQGNISQDKKWEPLFQNEVMETYRRLTLSSLTSAPDLIVWPETALPFFPGRDAERTAALGRLQSETGAHLVTGAVLIKEEKKAGTLLSNSALLLDGEGRTVGSYDKIHLVPFGEYVPLRSILFFIDKLVVGIGDFVSGDRYARLVTPSGSFAPLICYEVIFPGLVRKFFRNGGDFIVNITNDAWFGRTAGPFQHFDMAVFRAIETRKPLLRSANTGISGAIDSCGRVLSTTRLFETQALIAQIRTDATITFYTKYGDLFAYCCFLAAIIFLSNLKSWR